MCDSPADPRQVAVAVPRPAPGSAVDPIALEPVDEIVITTLVDNVFDGLLTGDERTTRAPLTAGRTQAPQFETGSTTVGMMAEHGFSALVSVRRGASTTTLLFDTGLSPDAMVTNASRLGTDLSQIQAVVLSHGHFDHAGGLAGLAAKQGTRSLPMVVHPMIWTRRRLAVPGREPDELPTLSKRALEGEGLAVIERREPSLLADGCVLITGEVDRTTEFEHGMPPPHQRWTGSTWQHDPWSSTIRPSSCRYAGAASWCSPAAGTPARSTSSGTRNGSPACHAFPAWSAACTSAARRSSRSSALPWTRSPG